MKVSIKLFKIENSNLVEKQKFLVYYLLSHFLLVGIITRYQKEADNSKAFRHRKRNACRSQWGAMTPPFSVGVVEIYGGVASCPINDGVAVDINEIEQVLDK